MHRNKKMSEHLTNSCFLSTVCERKRARLKFLTLRAILSTLSLSKPPCLYTSRIGSFVFDWSVVGEGHPDGVCIGGYSGNGKSCVANHHTRVDKRWLVTVKKNRKNSLTWSGVHSTSATCCNYTFQRDSNLYRFM